MIFIKEKKLNKNFCYTILFTITFRCNDRCGFCIRSDFFKKSIPDLTLNEIKRNYLFLKKKFNIRRVSLSGGEPTLHPQILEILDFFKREKIDLHLVSNLLKLSDKKFFKKIYPYFQSKKQKNQIEASINDLPHISPNANLRIQGLINIIKHKIPVEIITTVSRNNVEYLPNLVRFVKNILYKYSSNKFLVSSWEIRSLYISETPREVVKKYLPQNFYQFKKAIEKSIHILNSPPPVKIILWHLPLCYFKNSDLSALGAMKKRINYYNIWVYKNLQFHKAEILRRRKEYEACLGCRFINVCTGMCNKEYMERYNFPPFRPIKTMQ